MKIQIRRAKRSDVLRIMKMGKDPSFMVSRKIPFYEQKEVEYWLKDRQALIFVAEKDHQLVGLLFCKMVSPWWAMLDGLFVRPSWRCLGVGDLLLSALVRHLKRKKCEYISVLVTEGDRESFRFLLQRGFDAAKSYRWLERHL